MRALRKNSHTQFVSFSGIDGAGKSTQIDALCGYMKERGLRVRLIRFWDDIAKLTRIREATGHSIFKGDKGAGTPAAPISRRDKNVKSWAMTVVRLMLYSIDAVSVRHAVKKALRPEADFNPDKIDLVIFDRYIYDELANLTLSNPAIRVYVRLIMKIVPRPDISYLLDADPVKARERKPEYPLEFLHTNRQSYMALNDLVGGMTVIAPMPIQEVEQTILGYALKELSVRAHEHDDDIGIKDNVDGTSSIDRDSGQAKLDRPQTHPAAS